jgi:hypothetical protein
MISWTIYNGIDTALIWAEAVGVLRRYLLDCAHNLVPRFVKQLKHRSQSQLQFFSETLMKTWQERGKLHPF